MIYELLKYYKKELGLYKIIFKHIKFWYYLFLSSPFICGGLVFIISFIQKKFHLIALFAFTLIPFGILLLVLNSKTKKIVKKIYNVSSSEFMWNSYEVLGKIREHKAQKMLHHLKSMDKSIDSKDIRDLADTAEEKVEELKVKFPLIPSFFAALFVSLWNNFFSWIFKSEYTNDLNVGIGLFIISIMLLGIIIALFLGMRLVLNTIMDDLINKDSRYMSQLSQLLKNISKNLDKEEIKSKSSETKNN